jgi:hypothetical protein
MRKILFIAVGIILLVVAVQAQTIFVANNNPGAATGTNVFTGTFALSSAITAASAGDFIYIVPSATTYDDITITKALTIFGLGIRADKDLVSKSLVKNIAINASNVRLSGIIGGSIVLNSPLNGITIENSRFVNISMAGGSVSNVLIRNNVITGTAAVATNILLGNTSNVTIANNVLLSGNNVQPMVQALNATFIYNIFMDDGDEGPFLNVVDCIFDHNIFYGVDVDIPASSTGNTWTNNLSFGNPTDADNAFNITTNSNSGSGNIESTSAVPRDPQFINLSLTFTWDDSWDFSLLAGSPALSTDPLNLTTEDIGPSGGAAPFNFEGNILPLIQSVTIPSVIPVGSDLPVTIKAKGN